MAERGGFEPPNGNIPLTVFETAAFDRSAISPDYAKSELRYNIARKNKKSKRDRVFLGVSGPFERAQAETTGPKNRFVRYIFPRMCADSA